MRQRTELMMIEQAFFNAKAARARVAIEHAFGILKARWTALRNLRFKCATADDEAYAHGAIQAAFILHNICIQTWKDFITASDLEQMREIDTDRQQRGAEVYASYPSHQQNGRRREVLVKQMLAIAPPEIPVEQLYI